MNKIEFKPRDILAISYPNGASEAWYISHFNGSYFLVSVTDGSFHETICHMNITDLEDFQNVVSTHFWGQMIRVVPHGRARITIKLL